MKPMQFLVILVVMAPALAMVSTPLSAIAPGDVLINEAAFKETSDWIELYVQQAADYQGLRVYEGTTLVKELPKITASAGDYIVLHFKGNPANDERDATGKGANGYWDVYTGDTGLTGTDNVVRIQRAGTGAVHQTDTIDAVIWSNDNGNYTANKTVANDLVAAGHWDTGADFSSTRDSDAWTDSDGVKAGKSIGRNASSTDTNSRADWYLFTSQTPGAANPTMGTPGDLLINEVAPSEDNDWVELYNTSAGDVDIGYWLVKERTSVVKTFSSYAITPGEYIVLNFGGDPADDEIAGDTNGNGYRDFYTADSGLVGTDNVIILEDGASTMIDALAFANNNGTWAGAQQTAFNNIVEAAHWQGTVDGGAAVNEPECADWSNGAKGKSLGRIAWSTDTDKRDDWYLALQTKGEINPGWPYSVAVTADPLSMPADGASVSTIEAIVKDKNSNPVADGTRVVFATDLGSLSDTAAETVNGVATVTLRAGTVPGQARVTARSLWASGQVSVRLDFIPTQTGARIQLPAIDNEHGWETLIQVQNVGDEDTGAIAFFWGEYSGMCSNNDPGPVGVACMMLPEGAAWTLRAKIPESARSAIVYSVDNDVFQEACEDAADAVDDSDDWKDWEDDYEEGENIGERVAVIARREGSNDYGAMVSSAYTGIPSTGSGHRSEDMDGTGPPYQYFAPYAMRQYFDLDTEMVIQNSGQRCTSIWLYYQQQAEDCRFSYSEHIELLAPGESVRKKAPQALGVGWLGSVYVTANEPLGIIVDQTSFPPSVDRGVLLTHRARPYKLTTDTLFYAGLVFRELSGWEASVQVQNLTQESLPTFVTVEFFDASGDSILYLGDWVCPAGGTTFYLPAIADLGVEYAGSAVIQSYSQVGYPGSEAADGQPIIAVVDLKKAGMAAQGGSYNAHAEGEIQGASVIALPFLARDYREVTSLVAIRNGSNCNDIELKLEARDETGAVVSLMDNFWLRAGHLKLVDLDSVSSVAPGFAGAGIAEVAEVQQLCDMDDDGDADQEPLMLSVVVVNQGVGAGDVTWTYEGIPAR